MLNRLVKAVSVRFSADLRRRGRLEIAHAVIGQSKLFDAQWYAERYPDVVAAGRDPLDHFIRDGAGEGRNPSDRFDLRWYLTRNPDVARSGINPLLHYLQHGRDEGRSIRAVGAKTHTDEDLDPEPGPQKKKGGPDKPRAEPYPSDFTTIWQARPVVWSAFSSQLKNGAQQVAAKSDGNVTAASWLARFMQTEHAESSESARIWLFRAMRRDSPLSDGGPEAQCRDLDMAARQHAHRLLTTYGLGLEPIADGWFSSRGQLVLRLRDGRVGAKCLCAFQYNAAGDLAYCAEVEVVDGEILLIRLDLVHELCPVLLTWHSSDGALTDSALLPFPSLFRGGLHHSEIPASDVLSGERNTLGSHMTSLALQTYCWANPDEGFAIGRIKVDLRAANGSETLFSAGTVAALAAQFGIEMEARSSGLEDASQRLERNLRAEFHGDRVAARAKTGSTLILPVDGFPSLHCLAARIGKEELGMSSFCVVDAGTHLPEALVCQPPGSAGLSMLLHPALPLPSPIVQEKTSGTHTASAHFGAPIMIRFRDAKVWKVDPLMPLSPDTSMPALPIEREPTDNQRARISVIIDSPGSDDQLSLCMTSLGHQTIVGDLEILLVGQESIPRAAAELFGEQRIGLCPASGASPADRRNEAAASCVTSEYLLFLDAAVCLPDPRTLALLLTIADQPGVASASCALVREDPADGSTSVECAGYFEQWQDDRGEQASLTRRSDVAQLFPASTYPVVANDMRLCLVPNDVWRDLGGLNASDFPHSGFDADFGLRARAARLDNYCTTLTRAAIARKAPTAETIDEIALPAIPQDLREQLSRQVARIRKLGR